MLKYKYYLTFLILLGLFSQSLAEYKRLNMYSARSSTKVELSKEKHLQLDFTKSMIRQMRSGSEYAFIHITALNGTFSYTITGSDPGKIAETDKRPELSITGEITNGEVDHLIVVGSTSPVWHELQETRFLYITLDAKSPNVSALIDYMAADSVFLAAGTRCLARVENIDTFKIKTSVTKFNGNHHTKFMFEALKHTGIISLSGFGLKGERDPTPETKSFDLIKFDKDKIGYVLDQSDPLYCTDGICTYSLAVKMTNIGLLEVYIGDHLGMEPLEGNLHTVNYFSTRSVTSKKSQTRLISTPTQWASLSQI